MSTVGLTPQGGSQALLYCLVLAFASATAYADDTVRHFDIQSQVASLALKEFARQADISLVFSSTAVANHQTTGIRGDFTVLDGLKKLLDGSGLSFKQVSATTIAINAVTTTSTNPDPPGDEPTAKPARDPSNTKGETDIDRKSVV